MTCTVQHSNVVIINRTPELRRTSMPDSPCMGCLITVPSPAPAATRRSSSQGADTPSSPTTSPLLMLCRSCTSMPWSGVAKSSARSTRSLALLGLLLLSSLLLLLEMDASRRSSLGCDGSGCGTWFEAAAAAFSAGKSHDLCYLYVWIPMIKAKAQLFVIPMLLIPMLLMAAVKQSGNLLLPHSNTDIRIYKDSTDDIYQHM